MGAVIHNPDYNMQENELKHLFVRLGFGAITAGPEKVAGGLLHKMWRVETASGVYAVKQLNPEIMKRPNIEHIYILSEMIASAYAADGIPAIPAIKHEGCPLHQCGADMVMVYDWFDGAPVAVGSVERGRSFRIGAMLASLHKYQPEISGLEPPLFKGFGEDHWQNLRQQANQKRPPWMSDFEPAFADIISLSAQYHQAAGALRDELVISHRDMDQKNILWTADDSPAIIDWEAAGLTNPAMELFDGALNWSGRAVGSDGLGSFEAYIRGHRSTKEAPQTSGRAAFLGVLGNWMEWLEFNIGRSIGGDYVAAERKLGESEVASTLKIIQMLDTRSEPLVERYEKSIK